MSTTVPEALVEPVPQIPRRQVASWIGLLAGLSAVIGVLAGMLWAGVVELPVYTITDDGSATIAERALTEVVATDISFVLIGAGCGLGLGLVAWRWFRTLGWPSALLAAGAGLVSGLVCWWFGQLLGPSHFADRLAAAQVGELVPISLELRSWSALAVWGLAGITPVLLASSFGPDPEEPPRPGRGAEAEDEPVDLGQVDERGVLTETEEGSG